MAEEASVNIMTEEFWADVLKFSERDLANGVKLDPMLKR